MCLTMSQFVFPAEGAPVTHRQLHDLGIQAGADVESIQVDGGLVFVEVFGLLDDVANYGDLLDEALGDEHYYREYDVDITDAFLEIKFGGKYNAKLV